MAHRLTVGVQSLGNRLPSGWGKNTGCKVLRVACWGAGEQRHRLAGERSALHFSQLGSLSLSGLPPPIFPLPTVGLAHPVAYLCTAGGRRQGGVPRVEPLPLQAGGGGACGRGQHLHQAG